MSTYIDTGISFFDNGNISWWDICLGLNECETKEILSFKGVRFRIENHAICVDDESKDKENKTTVRYFVDVNNLISCISVVNKGLTEVCAKNEYQNLCKKFESLNFKQEKEEKINEYGIKSIYTNSICEVEFYQNCNKLLRDFGKTNCYWINVTIRSRLITKDTPYNIRKDILRLYVNSKPTKPASCSSNKFYTNLFSFYKYKTVLAVLVLIGVIIFIPWPTEKNNQMSPLYSGETENKNVVYICTGLTSKKYHKTPECLWLENCSGEIEGIPITKAEKLGRKPCKSCYQKK